VEAVEEQPDDAPAAEVVEDDESGHGVPLADSIAEEDQCEGTQLEEESLADNGHGATQAESEHAREEPGARKSKAAKRKANQKKKSNPQEGADIVAEEEAHEQSREEAKQSVKVDVGSERAPNKDRQLNAEQSEKKIEGGSRRKVEVKCEEPAAEHGVEDMNMQQKVDDLKAAQATKSPRKGWGSSADDSSAKGAEDESKKKSWPMLERNPLVKKGSVSKPLVADAPEFVPAFAMAPQSTLVTQTQGSGLKGKKDQKRKGSEESVDAGSSEDHLLLKQEKQHALVADAPEFVPASAMNSAVEAQSFHQKGEREARHKDADDSGEAGSSEDQMAQSLPITTMMITGIPAHHTSDSFREQLDAWGLLGTYDFFFMPSSQDSMGSGFAYVNFIDPVFATLCQWLLQQYQVEGTATPFQVQGLDGNVAYWSQYSCMEGMASGPLIIQSPLPSQWAVNGVNMMLNSKFSPQIRDQFHKTKMCSFAKKSKCALGSSCPFAHNKDELQAVPDLAKTKLCYNFSAGSATTPTASLHMATRSLGLRKVSTRQSSADGGAMARARLGMRAATLTAWRSCARRTAWLGQTCTTWTQWAITSSKTPPATSRVLFPRALRASFRGLRQVLGTVRRRVSRASAA